MKSLLADATAEKEIMYEVKEKKCFSRPLSFVNGIDR